MRGLRLAAVGAFFAFVCVASAEASTHGRRSLMRRVLVSSLVGAAALVWVASLGAQPVARAGSSYDGLTLQATAFLKGGGGGGNQSCTFTTTSIRTPAITVVHPAPGGATASRMVVGVDTYANSTIGYGGLVDLRQPGVSLFFYTAPTNGCAPLTASGTSLAGSVYEIHWSEQICDDSTCAHMHDGASGTGCLSSAVSGQSMTATVEFGGCETGSFPPPPAGGAASTGVQRMTPGFLNGVLLRVHGDSFRVLKTGQSRCANTFAGLWSGVTGVPEILRSANPRLVFDDSGLLLSLNQKGQVYDWGGAIPVLVRGAWQNAWFSYTRTQKAACRLLPPARATSSTLPIYLFTGKTYLGRAWVKVTATDPSSEWSALISFGSKSFD